MMITGLLLAALAVAARGGDDAEETLFLMMSMPRSGTEWLRSMLNDHPEICCDGEPLLRLGRTTGSLSDGEQAAALRDVLVSASAGRSDAHGVLKPCKKRGARARGFKWFDGQGGARVDPPNAALGELTTWMGERRVRLILLERQGLAKLVSDKLKHRSSQLGTRAVPTHCRDAACVARVNAQRISLRGDVAADLDASVAAFGKYVHWARRAVPYDDLLYVRYEDLVDDPEREMRRVYAFLDVDRAHVTNASLIVKSVTTPLPDLVDNYADVAAQLAKSGWARQVVEGEPPAAAAARGRTPGRGD